MGRKKPTGRWKKYNNLTVAGVCGRTYVWQKEGSSGEASMIDKNTIIFTHTGWSWCFTCYLWSWNSFLFWRERKLILLIHNYQSWCRISLQVVQNTGNGWKGERGRKVGNIQSPSFEKSSKKNISDFPRFVIHNEIKYDILGERGTTAGSWSVPVLQGQK